MPMLHRIRQGFQSTLLIRGATWWQTGACGWCHNFNPRSSYEERHDGFLRHALAAEISIHAPHTRSDIGRKSNLTGQAISIHAPHTRSDECGLRALRSPDISIHAPHTRSDASPELANRFPAQFQSTLLIRGATTEYGDFYIQDMISIHAPHTRSDRAGRGNRPPARDFNPRSSYEERHALHTIRMFHHVFQSTLLIRGATPVCVNS